mmetsp:Transcript_22269/g.50886  ORF Transcript_22269/g.50886 Transcript_22269/m.50886 type:complete len:901 (+) Transcript_22269:53-2755(+)
MSTAVYQATYGPSPAVAGRTLGSPRAVAATVSQGIPANRACIRPCTVSRNASPRSVASQFASRNLDPPCRAGAAATRLQRRLPAQASSGPRRYVQVAMYEKHARGASPVQRSTSVAEAIANQASLQDAADEAEETPGKAQDLKADCATQTTELEDVAVQCAAKDSSPGENLQPASGEEVSSRGRSPNPKARLAPGGSCANDSTLLDGSSLNVSINASILSEGGTILGYRSPEHVSATPPTRPVRPRQSQSPSRSSTFMLDVGLLRKNLFEEAQSCKSSTVGDSTEAGSAGGESSSVACTPGVDIEDACTAFNWPTMNSTSSTCSRTSGRSSSHESLPMSATASNPQEASEPAPWAPIRVKSLAAERTPELAARLLPDETPLTPQSNNITKRARSRESRLQTVTDLVRVDLATKGLQEHRQSAPEANGSPCPKSRSPIQSPSSLSCRASLASDCPSFAPGRSSFATGTTRQSIAAGLGEPIMEESDVLLQSLPHQSSESRLPEEPDLSSTAEVEAQSAHETPLSAKGKPSTPAACYRGGSVALPMRAQKHIVSRGQSVVLPATMSQVPQRFSSVLGTDVNKENLKNSVPRQFWRSYKLIAFDFDLTLSTTMLGFCEDGRHKDMSEVSASDFGGEGRVELLKTMFMVLKSCNVHFFIISYGWLDRVRMSLKQVGLLEYFSEGNLVCRESVELRQSVGNKVGVVKQRMERLSLRPEEALLIDDSWDNVQGSGGICTAFCCGEEPPGLSEEAVRCLMNGYADKGKVNESPEKPLRLQIGHYGKAIGEPPLEAAKGLAKHLAMPRSSSSHRLSSDTGSQLGTTNLVEPPPQPTCAGSMVVTPTQPVGGGCMVVPARCRFSSPVMEKHLPQPMPVGIQPSLYHPRFMTPAKRATAVQVVRHPGAAV